MASHPPPPPGTPTLEQYLQSRGPLAAHELVPLFGPLMDELAAFHASGGVQANLSTDTIFVEQGPAGPRLRRAAPGAPPLHVWPYFQAPEQIAGGMALGYWTDVYSLAAVIYRALTGQPPFPGNTVDEVRTGHLQYPQPTLLMIRQDLSPALDQALIHAMGKAPAERTPGMAALKTALEQAGAPPVMAGGGAPFASSAPPPPQVPGTMRASAAPPKTRSGLVVAVAALAMVGASVAVFFLTSRQESSSEDEASKPPPTAAMAVAARDRAARERAREPSKSRGRAAASDATPGKGGADAARIPRTFVPIQGHPVLGSPDAPVVVAMYGDLQCPFTGRALPLLIQLHEKYPQDVRVVWLDFPLAFHRMALPAAVAARAVYEQAGSKACFTFLQKVVANRRQLTPENLVTWAEEAGAKPEGVKAALAAGTHRAAIQQEVKAAQKTGVRGTPTLFVNGRKFRGSRSVAHLSEWVEMELAQARAVIARGNTSRGGYYRYLMKTASGARGAGTGGGTGIDLPSPGAPAPRPRAKRRRFDPTAIYRVPLLRKEPWRGAKRPLVVIVEYSDFQCPYCRYAACAVNELMRNRRYKRTVRHIFRNMPLAMHKLALPSAEAAMTVYARKGNRGFWKMHDRLFPMKRCPRHTADVKPRDWLKGAAMKNDHLAYGALVKAARRSGMRTSRFRRYMSAHRYEKSVRAHMRLARELGVRGVPVFFVNGRMVRGARPYPSLKKVVDEELKKARRLLRKHVRRRNLYKKITGKGLTRLKTLR